jgi:hypothetical protein
MTTDIRFFEVKAYSTTSASLPLRFIAAVVDLVLVVVVVIL